VNSQGERSARCSLDRLLGTGPFPWYRLRRQVVYDLDECLGIIAATRVNPAGSGSPNDTVFRGFRNKQPQALNDARHVSIVGDDDILIDVCSMDLLDGGND
jgi:hypothetical protein